VRDKRIGDARVGLTGVEGKREFAEQGLPGPARGQMNPDGVMPFFERIAIPLLLAIVGWHPQAYFSTTVIVGLALVLLMKTSLFPEMRIAVVPLPTLPTPFAGKEYVKFKF
jgi:hypothetical protein